MGNPNEHLIDARAASRTLFQVIKGAPSEPPTMERMTAVATALAEVGAVLASNFNELDAHVSAGGYLPADWDRVSTMLPPRDELTAVLSELNNKPEALSGPLSELAEGILERLAERLTVTGRGEAAVSLPSVDDLASVLSALTDCGMVPELDLYEFAAAMLDGLRAGNQPVPARKPTMVVPSVEGLMAVLAEAQAKTDDPVNGRDPLRYAAAVLAGLRGAA
jgi:hypothetical protein